MSEVWRILVVTTLFAGCVDVPQLFRDNPCDPAVGGRCEGPPTPDMVLPDLRVLDRGPDGSGGQVVVDMGVDVQVDMADAAVIADVEPDLAPDMTPDQGCIPAAEACNGLDDDCDGDVDELMPIACYSGPIETRNVGECASGRILCEDGNWTECRGAILPRAEQCDTLDDDCDGAVDEGGVCD